MSPSQREPATNWAGNISLGRVRTHRPGSIDELRRIVSGARRIRPVGTCHSFSPIIEYGDDLVRLDGMPAEVVIDAASRTATVAAGMRYADVVAELRRAGVALANL